MFRDVDVLLAARELWRRRLLNTPLHVHAETKKAFLKNDGLRLYFNSSRNPTLMRINFNGLRRGFLELAGPNSSLVPGGLLKWLERYWTIKAVLS